MNKLLVIVIICLSLAGCREEFAITELPERTYDFTLRPELTPQNIVSVELLENIRIGETLNPLNRQNAEVVFSGTDVPGGSIPMAFNSTSQKYHLEREDFRVREGQSYELSLIIPDMEMDTIKAWTMIPRATSIAAAEVISTKQIPIDSEYSNFEIELSVKLGRPAQLPAYYLFQPFRLESTLRKTDNGNIILSNPGTKSELEIIDVYNNQNAISKFDARGGILIDESRLNEDVLTMKLLTKVPLKDGVGVDLSDGKDILRNLRLELTTLSVELLEYYQLVDDVLAQGSSFSYSSRTISNIDNALGVFAGGSQTTTFLQIN